MLCKNSEKNRFKRTHLFVNAKQCGQLWTVDSCLQPNLRTHYDATSLLANHRCYYATSATIIAKLAEVDALPSAQVEAAIGDGNGERYARQRALGMAGHVVATLVGVAIVGFVFAHQAVVYLLHVGTHGGVVVLVDGEGATGVLHKQIQDARTGQRWQLRHYLASD